MLAYRFIEFRPAPIPSPTPSSKLAATLSFGSSAAGSCAGRDFAYAVLADAVTTAWPGPEIGQHNDYVLRELLGLTDQEVIELVSDEALE